MIYKNPNLRFKNDIPSGEICWQSPSNIALIKYWGKKEHQIPQNPSLSFSLKNAHTTTTLKYAPVQGKTTSVDFYLNGNPNPAFAEKTANYFQRLTAIFPFLSQLDFTIHSENTFPHSAGIASSASGMSALALALCDLERQYFGTTSDKDFYQKASYLARLGSGSACRSVYGGWNIWGETSAQKNTSDLYAVPVADEVHPDFEQYQDTIILVETEAKKVSSRAGHALMNHHPFAAERFQQAHTNLNLLLEALKTGDLENFIRISESEALTLHAMMMTSDPYFILMKPETLRILDSIQDFRKTTGIPLSFTLDAGPNVHLLYPLSVKEKVMQFLQEEIAGWVGKNHWIEDELGSGPEKVTAS